MGTVHEWREVLISGALWGSLMMLWNVFSRRSRGKAPAPYLNLLMWAIAGFFYGFGVTFGFRAFRWPLITVMASTIVALVLVAIIYGRKIRSWQSNRPSISS